MLIKILLVAAAVVVVVAITVATRPAAFRIVRSITIAAPASIVFAQLDDFHRWLAWSPYEKLDPGMRKSYLGASSGSGAIFHYIGRKAGEGRMTMTEVRPNERLAIRAEFLKPVKATNDVVFTLNPASNGVTVTWAMNGRNNFVFKAFGLVVDIDRLIGKDFEMGLAELKRLSEQQAAHVVAHIS
jgi:hypothetical protein